MILLNCLTLPSWFNDSLKQNEFDDAFVQYESDRNIYKSARALGFSWTLEQPYALVTLPKPSILDFKIVITVG
jgi:hypothetical protein